MIECKIRSKFYKKKKTLLMKREKKLFIYVGYTEKKCWIKITSDDKSNKISGGVNLPI